MTIEKALKDEILMDQAEVTWSIWENVYPVDWLQGEPLLGKKRTMEYYKYCVSQENHIRNYFGALITPPGNKDKPCMRGYKRNLTKDEKEPYCKTYCPHKNIHRNIESGLARFFEFMELARKVI